MIGKCFHNVHEMFFMNLICCSLLAAEGITYEKNTHKLMVPW